ncbi:MAG: McrC family protein [Blautia sp.]|nr:McrC family protein [Blautia sp.]MCM1201854.1 McrC family protein [Bacteroides fragilis]
MKQILVRELKEYHLRELVGDVYSEDLYNELYEKSTIIKKKLGLHVEPVSIFRRNGRRCIKFIGIAGILSLKSIEIEIMPKFYREDNCWRENLFTMISLAESGRIEAQRSKNMRYTSRNVYDHVGMLYVDEMEQALRKESIHSYRSIKESSRYLRGHILLSEELRSVVSHPGIICYERDVLEQENEFNYLLSWCVDYLLVHCKSKVVKRQLGAVKDRLPNVHGRYNIPVLSKLPPQYEHYANAVKTANNVALGASMQHSRGGGVGYGYIVATEVIYEKFIERILKSIKEHRKEFSSEAQTSVVFANSMHEKMPSYYTVPDNKIIINGEPGLLIDAKYKDNFKTGSRKKPINSDVYQLFSSLVSHGCSKGILLSPCDLDEDESARYWSIDNDGKQYIICSLCVNLRDISNKKAIDDFRNRLIESIDDVLRLSTKKEG